MQMASDVKRWTVDDLAAMPDDGQRYEVIDGELFVTPSPRLVHQDGVLLLATLIAPFVKRNRVGHLILAPADVTLSLERGVQPDLFVAPLIGGRRPRELAELRDLLLVIEVSSPSTARWDRVKKRALYRAEGIPDYWLVDIDARTFERSAPGDERIEVLSERIEWHPAGAPEPLSIDIAQFFIELLDEE